MQNGQRVRVTVDDKPSTFTVAEILFDDDDREQQVGQDRPPRDATRWRELLIVRTTAGRIAVRDAYRTRWMDERPSETWHVYADEQAAAAALAPRVTEHLPRVALRNLEWWDFVAQEL